MAKELAADRAEKLALIKELSLAPFQEKLAEVLGVSPTTEELKAFARKSPGDWGNLVRTLANLAGYSEKREVKHSGILGHVHAMSDAELQAHARAMVEADQKFIDITPDLSDNVGKEGEPQRCLIDGSPSS